MKTTRFFSLQGLFVVLAFAFSMPASAFDEGDWLFRIGGSVVDPKSNNHPVVSVDDGTSLTFTLSYLMTRNWSFEVLAAYPFEHDVELIGGPKVADVEHLPPTFSLNYRFAPDSKFQPYLGVGVNYTTFFSESTTGPLAGSNLSLDDSWGIAYQVGADILLNEKWFINLNARYIDIDTDATLDGGDLGTVEIDPTVYGIHLGFKF